MCAKTQISIYGNKNSMTSQPRHGFHVREVRKFYANGGKKKKNENVESERKGIRKELKIYSETREERDPVGNFCRKGRIRF